jgi:putative thioredoxin
MMIARGDTDDAIALLGRIPETPRDPSAVGRGPPGVPAGRRGRVDVDSLLDGLLDRVRDDPAARQEFLDLLETLGPDDPRTTGYRKALSTRLF